MPPKSLTLAIDTSAAHCAAALFQGSDLLIEKTEGMSKGQSERLFPMIEELFQETSNSVQTLGLIAVCTGPGNFTGIRLGVAAARGLALGQNCQAIGVSRFEAIASDQTGDFHVIIDARRGHFYVQEFKDARAVAPATETSELPQGRLIFDPYYQGELKDVTLSKSNIVTSCGRIAIANRNHTHPRPAPLYIRAADASPSSTPPLKILE